jgi:hypothetical protein
MVQSCNSKISIPGGSILLGSHILGMLFHYSWFILAKSNSIQVYQIGRAITAITLVEGTVHVAREHALQLIHLEEQLHIFWELSIQRFFLSSPTLMLWINRTYSFIHIPGTILFLVLLYYYTSQKSSSRDLGDVARSPAGPRLYEARRRTMAMCNLIAFIVFTIWPCMPPRLLSDKTVTGPSGDEARSYGFIDTVHGDGGEGSVWTQNKFCNQYGTYLFSALLLPSVTLSGLALTRENSRNAITPLWILSSHRSDTHNPTLTNASTYISGL